VLVIAGDNLFEFSCPTTSRSGAPKGTRAARRRLRLRRPRAGAGYGIVELDADDRIVVLRREAGRPAVDARCDATYLYSRHQLPLIAEYLAEGNAPDQAGSLVAWLYPREPGVRLPVRRDVVRHRRPEQLLEADNRMRRLRGLPERAEYSLEL
jgi:hypothetical protein